MHIALLLSLAFFGRASDVPAVVPGAYQPTDIVSRKHERDITASNTVVVVLFTDSSKSNTCSGCAEYKKTKWAAITDALHSTMDFAVADAATRVGKEFIQKYYNIDDALPVLKVFLAAGGSATPVNVATADALIETLGPHSLLPSGKYAKLGVTPAEL